jgi:hypothetical protein
MEASSVWPVPDDVGRCVLKPRGRLRWEYLFCSMLFTAGGIALLFLPTVSPNQTLIGMAIAVLMGGTSFVFLMTMFVWKNELILEPDGFVINNWRRKEGQRYAWTDIIQPFQAGILDDADDILFTTSAHKRRVFINVYGMPSPELAKMMNVYRDRAIGTAFATTAWPTFPPQKKRNIPFLGWVAILSLFALIFEIGPGEIACYVWSLAAPVSYAAHLLDDYDIANRAGHEPRFLPVLLARAQGGDKSGMYFMGDLYDPTDFLCETTVKKDAATAMYWYNQALPLNDQGAERSLGVFYHLGVGVERDDVTAASLFERAVTHNDDIGDYYLGMMLEHGQGEPQDLARAVRLEQASAAQGNEDGETELGRMYLTGTGVARDLAKARYYLGQAADQGDQAAQALLPLAAGT